MKQSKYIPKIEIWQRRLKGQDFFYDYSARLLNPLPGTVVNEGSGASIEKDTARLRAIYEVVERATAGRISQELSYGSTKVLSKRRLVFNPKKLILIASTKNRYKKFSDELVISWVKGLSLTYNRKLLVPAFGVFLGFNRLTDPNEHFSPSVSSGLAAGINFESAVKKGLEELIEQDAAMLCWYKRRPIPLLDIEKAKGGVLKFFYNKLKSYGLDGFVGITFDHIAYPTVIGIIVNQKNEYPYVSFGIGSGSIESAAAKSLEEALMVRNTLILQSKNSKMAKPINKKQVTGFLEHAIFNSFPEKVNNWRFLLEGKKFSSDELNKKFRFLPQNLYTLKTLIEICHHKDIEVVAVKLIDELSKIFGVTVVKVIAAGLQPFNFDFNLKPNLYERASELVRKNQKGLNIPHPFA